MSSICDSGRTATGALGRPSTGAGIGLAGVEGVGTEVAGTGTGTAGLGATIGAEAGFTQKINACTYTVWTNRHGVAEGQ